MKFIKIKDTNIVLEDGDRGKNYPNPSELLSKGYCLFLNNKNIVDNKLNLVESNYISEDKCNKLNAGLLSRNTIVLTTRGTLGNCLFIDQKFPLPCRINSGMIIIKPDKSYIPKFIYYFLCSSNFKSQINEMKSGAAQPQLPIKDILNMYLPIRNFSDQQHIVDTIGSVDDLIEKIEEKLNKIKEYGGLIFNKTIDCDLIDLLKIAKFEKGKEIGSANYLDKQKTNSVPYIRVGNLLNGEYDTYVVNSDCPQCDYEDILIAFDGAPGRNIIGLKGRYSSGVQKVVCDKENKGYIYFYINSELCQNTIKVHSQGTTILHASKSIKELKIPIISSDNKNLLNSLFNEMVSLIKQKSKLKKQKDLLLKKYFG